MRVFRAFGLRPQKRFLAHLHEQALWGLKQHFLIVFYNLLVGLIKSLDQQLHQKIRSHKEFQYSLKELIFQKIDDHLMPLKDRIIRHQ